MYYWLYMIIAYTVLYTPFNGELILTPLDFWRVLVAASSSGTAMDLFSGEEFWMLPVAWEGGSLGQAEIWGAFPKSGKGMKGAALGMHCEYIMGHKGMFFGTSWADFWGITGYFSGY